MEHYRVKSQKERVKEQRIEVIWELVGGFLLAFLLAFIITLYLVGNWY